MFLDVVSDIFFTLRSSNLVSMIFIFRLVGNPICTGATENYCLIPRRTDSSYKTPMNCLAPQCRSDQISSPTCQCAYPYTGTLFFRAPSFSDLGNSTTYLLLHDSLMFSLRSNRLPVDSVSLSNPIKNSDDYLLLNLQIFPSGQNYFNHTGISAIGFVLSNQTFKPPHLFGPFFFIADNYQYLTGSLASCSSTICLMCIRITLLFLNCVYTCVFFSRWSYWAEQVFI